MKPDTFSHRLSHHRFNFQSNFYIFISNRKLDDSIKEFVLFALTEADKSSERNIESVPVTVGTESGFQLMDVKFLTN